MFAQAELHERQAQQPPPLGAVPPLGASPMAEPRDEAADALDAAALLRTLNLGVLLLGARRRKPSPERAQRLAQRRARAETRSTRLGPRIGPRLGRWIGDWLLAAGLVAEFVGEAMDDELDEVEHELTAPDDGQQELPFRRPEENHE